jgi:hypothetical protein
MQNVLVAICTPLGVECTANSNYAPRAAQEQRARNDAAKEQTEREANLTNQNQAQKAYAQQQEKEMSITARTSTGQLSGRTRRLDSKGEHRL